MQFSGDHGLASQALQSRDYLQQNPLKQITVPSSDISYAQDDDSYDMNSQLNAFLEEFYSGAGGEVDGCQLMLRFFGDDLDPAKITDLLKVQPTSSCKKGDCRLGKSAVFERTGIWLIDCGDSGESADDQIRLLLARLPGNLDIWNELSQSYSAESRFIFRCPDGVGRRFCRPKSSRYSLSEDSN